jgi:hypothetical protein
MTKSKTVIAMNISQRIFAVSDSLAKAADEIIGQCEPRLTGLKREARPADLVGAAAARGMSKPTSIVLKLLCARCRA